MYSGRIASDKTDVRTLDLWIPFLALMIIRWLLAEGGGRVRLVEKGLLEEEWGVSMCGDGVEHKGELGSGMIDDTAGLLLE